MCQKRGIFVPEKPEPLYRVVQGMSVDEPVEGYVTGVALSWGIDDDNYLVEISDASLPKSGGCWVKIRKVNTFGIAERELSLAVESHKACAAYGSCKWNGSSLDITPSAVAFFSVA